MPTLRLGVCMYIYVCVDIYPLIYPIYCYYYYYYYYYYYPIIIRALLLSITHMWLLVLLSN